MLVSCQLRDSVGRCGIEGTAWTVVVDPKSYLYKGRYKGQSCDQTQCDQCQYLTRKKVSSTRSMESTASWIRKPGKPISFAYFWPRGCFYFLFKFLASGVFRLRMLGWCWCLSEVLSALMCWVPHLLELVLCALYLCAHPCSHVWVLDFLFIFVWCCCLMLNYCHCHV